MVPPVSHYATWRHILGLGLLAGVLAWLVVVIIGGQFAAATGGLEPFDMQPGLRAGDILAQLPSYTEESRHLYTRFFLVDFFLPLAAYGAVALLWAWLLARAAPGLAARHPWIALFPCLPLLFDWGENLAFLALIVAWPRHWAWLAELATWFQSGKFIGIVVSNVGLWCSPSACRTDGSARPRGRLIAFPNRKSHINSLAYARGHGHTGCRKSAGYRYPNSRRTPYMSKKLTTNAGCPVVDNQNVMTAGPRGPQLLQDIWFLEKLAHFDREVIPERRMHAKGSGAYGTFTVTHDISKYTCAKIFSKVGNKTELFARFSTVAGERGAADAERDIRGFAVKFYTEEGNWDLVGNNTPVFFLRDPLKFPDLNHAVKRDPRTNMRSAKNNWDFWTSLPEALHQVTIVMSDRGIPRPTATCTVSAATLSASSTRRTSATGSSSTWKPCRASRT